MNLGGSVSGTGGTFTAGTGTVNYNAAGAQTVAGVTYYNLTLSGSGNKTVPASASVSNNLSIAGTAKADLAAGTNHTVNSLTLGGFGKNSGTWGSTSSTAVNTDNTYFTATTGYLTVTTDTRLTQATLTVVANPFNRSVREHVRAEHEWRQRHGRRDL